MKELLIPMEVAERWLAAIQHGVFRPPEATALSHLGDCIRSAATFCDRCFDETHVTTSLRGPGLAPAVLSKSRGMTVDDVVGNRDRELQRLGLKGWARLAQAATDGFFDLHSAPPWGTWVGYFEEGTDSDSAYANYLLAWIPHRLIERVTVGIGVDCTASIQWVEDTHLEIKSILPHVNYGAA